MHNISDGTESDHRVYAEGIMLLITDEAALTRDKLTAGFCMCRWICCQIYKILHTHIKKTVKVGRINLMSTYHKKLTIFPVTFLLASLTLIKFVLFLKQN